MEKKKYICLIGVDYTEFIKTEKDVKLFEELIGAQEKTIGVPVKNCYKDVVMALQIGRQLEGGDPNTIVIAKTPIEGLAKLQAFSKITQN